MIMEEANVPVIKTITLSTVFEMELQNYQAKVDEIVNQAIQEQKNETQLRGIEETWKTMQFDLSEEGKNTDNYQIKIKAPDEIRLQLEENILTLQSIAASKFARAFSKRVKQWMDDLNVTSEVIEVWLRV